MKSVLIPIDQLWTVFRVREQMYAATWSFSGLTQEGHFALEKVAPSDEAYLEKCCWNDSERFSYNRLTPLPTDAALDRLQRTLSSVPRAEWMAFFEKHCPAEVERYRRKFVYGAASRSARGT